MDFETAKQKAIKYLGISKKTRYEVIKKLKSLKCSENIIYDVISYLEKLNYINDEEYVDAYIRQCVRLLNNSIYEIKNKLLQKGIKKDIIINRLSDLENSNYDDKLIEKLIKTKCKNMDLEKQKMFLYRRGLAKE